MPKFSFILIISEVPVYKENNVFTHIDQSYKKSIMSHIGSGFQKIVICTYGSIKC